MTSEEFRAMRKAADLTQKELADRLGVHVLTVARFEQGLRSISGPVEKLMGYVCVPSKKGSSH